MAITVVHLFAILEAFFNTSVKNIMHDSAHSARNGTRERGTNVDFRQCRHMTNARCQVKTQCPKLGTWTTVGPSVSTAYSALSHLPHQSKTDQIFMSSLRVCYVQS